MIAPAVARQGDEDAIRFAPLHVYIDSDDNALAAYQFELKVTEGDVKIVGVEGGEHKAFEEPAYYDPAALSNDRIIIAAFSTTDKLPTGKTRVATIHLQITGQTEPEYKLKLTVAGDKDGDEISAKITTIQGDEK
jgi:hypothetical protein